MRREVDLKFKKKEKKKKKENEFQSEHRQRVERLHSRNCGSFRQN